MFVILMSSVLLTRVERCLQAQGISCQCENEMGEMCPSIWAKMGPHPLFQLLSQWPDKPREPLFFPTQRLICSPKQLYRNRPRNSTISSKSISPHAIFIAMDTFNRCKQSYRSVSPAIYQLRLRGTILRDFAKICPARHIETQQTASRIASTSS